jgi:predicted  nucleic acid-binding Zn-ribbon protein
MLDVENREKQLKLTETEQKRQQAQVGQEKVAAREHTEKHERALNELLPQREALRKGVSADTLRHYDRVLRLRGSALAEARDQYCQVCHVMMRPQVFQDVMGGSQVLTCDSCSRILYFNPANATPAPAGSSDRKESLKKAVAETPE